MQKTETAIAPVASDHEQRLRAIVKRLVIDLGYLYAYCDTHPADVWLSAASSRIDEAIEDLNAGIDLEALQNNASD